MGSGILNIFAGALRAAGTEYAEEALDLLHGKSAEKHKSVITGGYIFCEAMAKEVKNTKTKLDDAAVLGLLDAIKASAEKYGIELPQVDNPSEDLS